MERMGFVLMAFVGGTFLALQGGLNARLGVLLKSPLLASVVAFVSSALFAILLAVVGKVSMPTEENLKLIPGYLWFMGGFFSVLGISLYYITIPKLGVSTMISLGLCGQLIFAVIAGHFGWLNLPEEPITIMRLVGVVCMIVGILFMNLN